MPQISQLRCNKPILGNKHFTKTCIRRTDQLNTPMSLKQIESIFNNFSKQKLPGFGVFFDKLYQIFKKIVDPQNLRQVCQFRKFILPNMSDYGP